MRVELTLLISFITYIDFIIGLNIGTYNTFQFTQGTGNTEIRDTLKPLQIQEIASSNLDIVCLQELNSPQTQLEYQFHPLITNIYPYSFGEAQTLDLTRPRAPCSSDEIQQIESICMTNICNSLYQQEVFEWGFCAAAQCQDEFFPLLGTECMNCFQYFPSQAPGSSIDIAVELCSQNQSIPFVTSDGNLLLSKYPILNHWYTPYEGWFGTKRAALTAEIDICSQLQSDSSSNDDESVDDDDCDNRIIVSCSHLAATDFLSQESFIPTSYVQINNDISDFIQLNAFQSKEIIENVFKAAPWNKDDDENKVIATFIAADLNVGKTFNSDNFAIWQDFGFISGKDLDDDISVMCTYCAHPNGTDLMNVLAVRECSGAQIFGCILNDIDIDHVLVLNDFTGKVQKYKRMFIDKYNVDIGGEIQKIPLSDHWGILINITLKKNKLTDSSNSEITGFTYFQDKWMEMVNTNSFVVMLICILFVSLLWFLTLLIYGCCFQACKNEKNGYKKAGKVML